MKTTRVQNRVVALVITIGLLLPVTSAQAGGSPAAGDKETTWDNNRSHVEVSFTKWLSPFPLLEGFVGGDVVGNFAGEVLDAKPTTNPSITSILWVEAVYEVQAGDHSFSALIHGGQNNQTGGAVLDGVILDGWRTGDLVHVEYQVKTNCLGAPPGTCFQGTIHIERASHD